MSFQLLSYPPITPLPENSFARFTIEVRIPKIIDDLIAENPIGEEIKYELRSFVKNQIIIPFRRIPDNGFWTTFLDTHEKQAWHNVPFMSLEIYIYNKLLEIIDYHSTGLDPFESIKQKDLKYHLNTIRDLIASIDSLNLKSCILLSLNSNKADLSQLQGAVGKTSHLLIDETDILIQHIIQRKGNQIDIILDNSGLELFGDIVLAHHLLKYDHCNQVYLHFKKVPFIVSDATTKDLDVLLSKIEDFGILAKEIKTFINSGQLNICTHDFWTSPKHYFELPKDLIAHFKHSHLTISKGDANYRRFLGDRKVPENSPISQFIDYFPTRLGLLRVCKSELISGLTNSKILKVSQQDPNWRFNGKYSIIQTA